MQDVKSEELIKLLALESKDVTFLFVVLIVSVTSDFLEWNLNESGF